MRGALALLPLAVQIVVAHGAVNYCGAKMCKHSDEHTFCKYRAGPSATCAGYIEAHLSAQEKTRVLARLNRRRSELARGWRHWPPAGDMLKLRWIEELSREAQRWADQCRPPRAPEERDACRDLYSISVGQCVASVLGEAPGLRPESMVDMWFMQSMSYDGNITSYTPTRNKNYYGDFAQMMWSRTYLVGCGRSRFMTEWRGRLRSVERLVCNFAPRGPVPTRPLWTPADAASMCPPRSYPDSLPGLCTYQQDVDESRNFNDSFTVQDNYLLDTVFELENNESLNYLGSLDQIYLTKIAIATIGTSMPITPLICSLKKRDVFEDSEKDNELLKTDNKSEVVSNNLETHQTIGVEKEVITSIPHRTKVNTVGRPKPYDINELSDPLGEQKFKNINDIEDLKRSKENDIYAEYGLAQTEDEDIMNTTTVEEIALTIHNDTITPMDAKAQMSGFTEIMNATNGMVASGHITAAWEEIRDSTTYKIVDDYLSDPETVRALQDALEQMERTLASPVPVETPGKVRRELRNLQADPKKVTNAMSREGVTAAREVFGNEALQGDERNQTSDRGPMLDMVLKYMPYLKSYEKTIVGDGRSYCPVLGYSGYVVITTSFLLHSIVTILH